MERYSRQVLFPGIGEAGQARLANARALLVGCGALGTVIANVLVRAGVGRLTIVDRDYVELSNLQRQVLFDEDDLASDLPKAVAAAAKLRRINPDVAIEPVVADLNATNVAARLEGAGAISYNADLLRLRLPDYEITVFPDARALIKGTTDPLIARSLYSRYVGL